MAGGLQEQERASENALTELERHRHARRADGCFSPCLFELGGCISQLLSTVLPHLRRATAASSVAQRRTAE